MPFNLALNGLVADAFLVTDAFLMADAFSAACTCFTDHRPAVGLLRRARLVFRRDNLVFSRGRFILTRKRLVFGPD